MIFQLEIGDGLGTVGFKQGRQTRERLPREDDPNQSGFVVHSSSGRTMPSRSIQPNVAPLTGRNSAAARPQLTGIQMAACSQRGG